MKREPPLMMGVILWLKFVSLDRWGFPVDRGEIDVWKDRLKWDSTMNDDKLPNYTPTLSKVIFPKRLQQIDSKHHLFCPSFPWKNSWTNTAVFPLDFYESVRHSTAKHQQKNQRPIFAPLTTKGDSLYIYYFCCYMGWFDCFLVATCNANIHPWKSRVFLNLKIHLHGFFRVPAVNFQRLDIQSW